VDYSVILLNKNLPHDTSAPYAGGDKPVLWSITGNYEPYEYVTGYGDKDENGELLPPDTPTGFAVEMIARTCDLCGLSCEWVLEDTQNCWTSAGFPGVGLQAGYFDACNAFTNTARRQLGVDFSDSIALPRAAVRGRVQKERKKGKGCIKCRAAASSLLRLLLRINSDGLRPLYRAH
jgi:hypothetical protein